MKEKIILKSAHPEFYPDLEVECRVLENDEIGEYVDNIPEERKFYASKHSKVSVRLGRKGEVVKTILKTNIDGKEYILSEEETTVKERSYHTSNGAEIKNNDVVVTNIESNSNEEYVVKFDKFLNTYVSTEIPNEYYPVPELRLLSQVDENLIIVTAWGSKAVCLKGSYIVTYNAEENDYNTLEKGAFESTYSKEEGKSKSKKMR